MHHRDPVTMGLRSSKKNLRLYQSLPSELEGPLTLLGSSFVVPNWILKTLHFYSLQQAGTSTSPNTQTLKCYSVLKNQVLVSTV